MRIKRIEVLVVEGCPHGDATIARVNEVLSTRAMTADIAIVQTAAGRKPSGYVSSDRRRCG